MHIVYAMLLWWQVALGKVYKEKQNPHLVRDTLGVSHGFGKRDVVFRGVDTQVSGNTVDSHPFRHHIRLQVKGSTQFDYCKASIGIFSWRVCTVGKMGISSVK